MLVKLIGFTFFPGQLTKRCPVHYSYCMENEWGGTDSSDTTQSESQVFTYRESANDITIKVLPFYLEEKSNPEEGRYIFAYMVKIKNNSTEPVTLTSRQWIIRNGHKREHFVKGRGVVGQTPVINPGDFFEYSSFCPLDTPTGNMRGKFLFENPDGSDFWVSTPLFFFRT